MILNLMSRLTTNPQMKKQREISSQIHNITMHLCWICLWRGQAFKKENFFNELPLLLGSEVVSSNGVNYIGGLPSWVTYPGGGLLTQNYTTQDAYTDNSTIPPTQGTIPVTHEAAFLDFSSFSGSASEIASLIGNGFHTTCCTCDRNYSVEFASGTSSSISYSGQHTIYKVGIDGARTGEDLIDLILAATTENPNNHYTNLIKNPGNSGELIIYDQRPNSNSVQSDLPAGASLDNGYASSGSVYLGIAGGRYGQFGPGVAHSPNEQAPGISKKLLGW